MPRKLRRPKSRTVPVNPRVFKIGDGTWSFFSTDAVYPDRESAAHAWPRYRREVWSSQRCTQPPGGALEWDGLTHDGFRALWANWNHVEFPTAEVLDAIGRDRDWVAAFRERDSGGAQEIGNYLEIWIAYLDTLEEVTRELADLPDYHERISLGVVNRIHQMSRTFADAVAAR